MAAQDAMDRKDHAGAMKELGHALYCMKCAKNGTAPKETDDEAEEVPAPKSKGLRDRLQRFGK